MIDYFALALTHALLAIALVRLAWRPDLDREGDASPLPPARASAPDAEDDAAPQPAASRRRRRRRDA